MADRLLALMGGTEAGRVEVAALADRRVNQLLAFADTDRDAAISQAEADAMQDQPTRRTGMAPAAAAAARGDGHGRPTARRRRRAPDADGPDGPARMTLRGARPAHRARAALRDGDGGARKGP